MKKLLLILLCFPMIGFGQTAEEYFEKAYNSSDDQYKIDNYTKCLRIDPDFAEAYNNRGAIYDELGNYEDAMADFTKAIKIDPDYSTAYYNRGDTYKELENYKNAIVDYTKAIKINPDFANAYDGRGTAMWYLKAEYCSDYIRACNLGVCSNYNKFCK